MSGERNDGGAAFPVIPPMDESGIGSASGYPYPESGMSLRDHFAGQCMNGICSHPDTWGMDVDQIAAQSYSMADAMLAAREAFYRTASTEQGR